MTFRLAHLSVVLAFAAIICLAVLGLPPGHSAMFNYAWANQYSEALSWTNPLPRYLPGLWAGFGGHDFFFYAPLPFWVAGAIVDPLCPGCEAPTEFAIAGGLFLVASGFAMFAFLRSFVAAPAAAFGAVTYAVLPYHLLIDWFMRQAAGEFAAYAFIPLIALGTENIRRGQRGGWILSLGVAGMALCHLPTTLLAAHVFGLLALLFILLESGGAGARFRLLLRLAWFAGLGLALASFYWLPALALLKTVSPELLFAPYFEAWRWLYGSTWAQPSVPFARSLLFSFAACVPILLASLAYARGLVLAWILVPVALLVLLNLAASEPIWRNWIISRVQFPWRLMVFADFSTAIAAAFMVAGARLRIARAVVLLAVAIPTLVVAAQTRFIMQPTAAERGLPKWFGAIEYLSPEMTEALRNQLDGTSMYYQLQVAETMAAMAADFAKTYPAVTILDRGPRSLTVLARPDASVLSLHTQYWSQWTVQDSNGDTLETRPNPAFGTLDIIAPAGGFREGPLVVSLNYHASELAGAAASLMAALALLATAIQAGRAGHQPRPRRRGEADGTGGHPA